MVAPASKGPSCSRVTTVVAAVAVAALVLADASAEALLLRPQRSSSTAATASLVHRARLPRIASTARSVSANEPATPTASAVPQTDRGSRRSRRTSQDGSRLTFLADFATDSSPVPAATAEEAVAYFRDPRHLSFGPSMPSTRVPTTPQLLGKWREACDQVNARRPTERDVVLNVRTVGVSIPGLTVEWSAYLGAKLLRQSNGYPIFEFVLIQDELEAKGLAPVTYIFDRITGSKNGKASGGSSSSSSNTIGSMKSNRDTHFFSTIGIEPQSNGHGTSPSSVFRCDRFIEINFRIPPLLFQLLGKDQKKSEERMSRVIGNAIEKDMKQALGTWEDSYRSWMKDAASSREGGA